MRQAVPDSRDADQLLLVLRCVQLEIGIPWLAGDLLGCLITCVGSADYAREACSHRGIPLEGHSECMTALLLPA